MSLTALPFDAPLSDYEQQADALLAGGKADGAVAIDRDDALLAIARWYEFADWRRLAEYVDAVRQPGPVARFERAVEAVIDGDVTTLSALLHEDPEIVRARSTRVNNFDPPMHRATLLHYLAANGVEGYRQRSPKNAVEVARVLLDAGADPNALSWAYGGQCTTMALLVSSTPPAQAGVQVPLVETLVKGGASLEPAGEGNWTSPLGTALVFGFQATADALVRLGAKVENVAVAAGLGRMDDVTRLLPSASAEDRHRALALAAQLGHPAIVTLLIDEGEDPNRFNPPGSHAHTPPIHQAIAADHLDVVTVLVDKGARLDIKDTIYQSSPLGWAEYLGKHAIADYLRAHGAPR
ncbi:MAG: ankyrin repeat domain-containing protein [Acidobacteriota bacterium]|nr:ankyrin repeat domain-containing protein [Acidobacteriota bacterium]